MTVCRGMAGVLFWTFFHPYPTFCAAAAQDKLASWSTPFSRCLAVHTGARWFELSLVESSVRRLACAVLSSVCLKLRKFFGQRLRVNVYVKVKVL